MTEWLFRFVLRLYPEPVRERFGPEMLDLMRWRRSRRASGTWFWMTLVRDATRAAPEAHLVVWRERRRQRAVGVRRNESKRPWVGGGGMNGGSGAGWGDHFLRDLKYALRGLTRRPWFSVAVVTQLALGIGATTALFSVVKPVLIDPLPFEGSDRLVVVMETDGRYSGIPISAPNLLDWREQSTAFEHIGAHTLRFVNLTGGGDPERVQGASVTAGTLEVYGTQPTLGRTFLPEEEESGNSRVAVISHGLWIRRFGGVQDILGASIGLDGDQYLVVGVMPPGFETPTPWSVGTRAEVWTPLPFTTDPETRGSHSYEGVARLREGVSLERAREQMDAISAGLAERYPDTNGESGVVLLPLKDALVAGAGGQLMMLFGAAAFVLLIACANVSGLLVARATGRQTEVAVRTALGAGRGRLLRQLLTENLPLSLLAGGVGLLLSVGGVATLRSMLPASLPHVDSVGVDGAVLLFTLVISLASGVLFALAPALSATRSDLAGSLKEGRSSQTGPARSRFRSVLVVSQFALTLVLANGAGLMLKSYARLSSVEQGFATENVITLGLSLRGPEYERQEQVRAFYDALLESVEALPGVRHAAAVSKLPLNGGTNTDVIVEGQGPDPSTSGGRLTEVTVVTPDYIDAMGIHLVAGRGLESQDSQIGQPGVLINEAMAGQLWPDEDPLGKRFSLRDPAQWRTVVGVVGNVRQWGIERSAVAETYLPFTPLVPDRMESFRRVRYLVVRAEVDPSTLVGAIRQAVLAIDPTQPVSQVRTMDEIVAASVAPRRFNTVVVGSFAFMALVLVATGIYGVMSYFVEQRRHEIGVRIALGSERRELIGLVMARGMKLGGVGLIVGLGGVLLTTRLTRSMLYGVSPLDPMGIGGTLLFLVALAALGSCLPALRATRVSSVEALHSE